MRTKVLDKLVFADQILLEAIQPIYQLNWANIAEENGESFSGCDICDVCPEGPGTDLLPIAREWVERIEKSTGSIGKAFRRLGIEKLEASRSWRYESSRGLYYVFMTFLGHGVGFSDFCHDHDLENPFDRFGKREIPYGEDCDVSELAEREYYALHPECKPSDWID